MSSWIQAASDASTIDAMATIRTTSWTDPRSSASGATDASAQARATIASAAGARAVTSGSVVSGTASVSCAAQVWNGMAPNRIATASANAR